MIIGVILLFLPSVILVMEQVTLSRTTVCLG
jgi:hypothetical protein